MGVDQAHQQELGEPDTADTYFIAVLDSLLALLDRSDPALAADLRDTTEAWRTAYLITPHGQPVELA